MSIDEFVDAVRAIALADGTRADERYWTPGAWRDKFADGLTPADAWDEAQNPALRAL